MQTVEEGMLIGDFREELREEVVFPSRIEDMADTEVSGIIDKGSKTRMGIHVGDREVVLGLEFLDMEEEVGIEFGSGKGDSALGGGDEGIGDEFGKVGGVGFDHASKADADGREVLEWRKAGNKEVFSTGFCEGFDVIGDVVGG